MKKKYDDKVLKETDEQTKDVPVDEQAAKPKEPSKEIWIVCIKECVVPGYGFWKPGDKTSDQFFISRLKDNPNFEEIKEEKTS